MSVVQGENGNVYHAIDEKNNVLGKGWIYASKPSDIYTYSRLDIFIEMEIYEKKHNTQIKDSIFDTLMAEANKIKSENPDQVVRVYNCCFSNDIESINYYCSKEGFVHDEGMHIIGLQMGTEPYMVNCKNDEIHYVSLPLNSDNEITRLIDVHKNVFRSGYSIEMIKELKQKKGWKSIAATYNGEIVGNIMLWVNEEDPNAPYGWVEDLFVLNDWRKKGIAKELITRGLAHFQELPVLEVKIEVWSANERAMKLYKEFGFEFQKETESSIGMFL
ncbi:MAG: GNAT family N-acetyltransferase [Anaerobacillus sp.]|uniref:GNAT family N-acetyltransferase n=1 Tax=Anaerobacillus sp. TaxID=1872506 RepID=UPI00391A2818